MKNLRGLLHGLKIRVLPYFVRGSVLTNWVLSYIFILLIALWSGYITYTISIDVIKKEVGGNYFASLSQLKLIIDSRLKDIENISTEMSLNKKLQNIIFQNKPLTEYQNYLLTDIISQLHNYKVVNEFIEDVNIYLPQSSLVVRNASLYDASDWYRVFYENSSMSYEDFLKILNSKHYNSYMHLPRKGPEGQQTNLIAYMQSLPIERYGDPYATVIINMQESVIKEYLTSYDWVSDGGFVFILDENNNVISSTGDVTNSKVLDYKNISDSRDITNVKINGVNSVLMHTKSDITGWVYAFVMPTSVFFEKLEKVRVISIATMGLCLLLGIGLTFYFSRKNYSPIGNMIKLFSRVKGFDKEFDKGLYSNEYRYIENSLMRMIKDREEIYNKMGQQQTALRNTFITKLLKGRVENSEVFYKACREYGMDFREGKFAVLLISIEDLHNLFFEGKTDMDTKSLELLAFVIRNIFEEQAGMSNAGYVAELDNMMACLINVRIDNLDEAKNELYRMASESKKLISAKFGVELCVSISSIHSSFTSIPDAYAETLEIMEYQRLVGDSPVMDYDSIGSSSEAALLSGFGDDKKFKNCIETGDFAGAREVLDNIFRKGFFNSKDAVSVHIMRFRMYALISLVMEALHDLTARYDYDIFHGINPEKRFLKCDTLIKLQNEMKNILDHVENYFKSRENTKGDTLIENVIQYINENYADSNLNVSAISDNFNITVPYLSKAFKKKTGKGLLDYIHSVRIEKAKEILKEKDISIKSIAEQTGYYNTVAFIRVFKKFEGVSPGKYGKYNITDGEDESE